MNSLVRSLLVVLALVALLVACAAQVIVSQLTKTAGDSDIAQEFVVEEEANLTDVAEQLQRAKLINQPVWFRLLAQFQDEEELGPLQAGTYYFSPSMSMRQMLVALHTPRATGEFEEVKGVMVPDASRLEQIADAISERMEFDPEEFMAVVRNGDYFKSLRQGGQPKYPVLKDLPEGASLEGYLAPNTYNFFKNATITDTVEVLLAQFNAQFEEAESSKTIEGRNNHEIVTMASIVQRESGNTKEMPTVASVFWNRIDPAKGFAGGRLDADPTVQYIVGTPDNWWPNINDKLTLEQINALNSPYNTRVNPGLPPGPIAAPGPSALAAAMAPEESNYFFFVAKCNPAPDEAKHNFAETIEEFSAFEQEFLNCTPEPTP